MSLVLGQITMESTGTIIIGLCPYTVAATSLVPFQSKICMCSVSNFGKYSLHLRTFKFHRKDNFTTYVYKHRYKLTDI